MPRDFHFAFMTDCESTQHAIRNPQLGERATRGLIEILNAEGIKGTFFAIPTEVEAAPALYREARAAGFAVELHVHPADQGYEEFLGVYGPDEQRAILSEAADRFAQTMGYRPRGICVGYASANDYTYPVLVELGFSYGMVSLPTRVLPECASVWAGAPLGMRYAHPHNRLLPGNLDFVDIPLTLDPECRMWGGKHPQDLRVELVDAKNHWYTMRKAVTRQSADDSIALPYLAGFTHNVFEYGDPRDFRRQTLERIIRDARAIIADQGGRMIGSTHEELAEEFRKLRPLNGSHSPALKLDARARR